MIDESGVAGEEVTSFAGAARIAASVAVMSRVPCSIGASGVAATGAVAGAESLSRECIHEHPETVTDRTSRPAAKRAPGTCFETMLHSSSETGTGYPTPAP